MSHLPATKRERNPAATRQRIVDATVRLMLKQGFGSTSVDQICEEAGLTKGSFFHHFESKEAIGKAAVEWWGQMGASFYMAAWKDDDRDPLVRVHQMLDIMSSFTERPGNPCVCMVGMMSQELSATHPIMQAACSKELAHWNDQVARMLVDAKALHCPQADFDPHEVASFLNSLWQGSMLVAKTRQDQSIIRANLRLAHHYVDSLFGITNTRL